MRFLPLRFGDGAIDGLFDTAIVPDVRDRIPEQIAKLILDRLRLAKRETSISDHKSSNFQNPTSLEFVRIRNESSYWKTSDAPRSGLKGLYPFDRPCKQYFYLESHMSQQDPVLDVLISNKREHPTIVLGVGVQIVETAQIEYFYGGQSPRSFRITQDDLFEIEMPTLRSVWPSLPKSYPPQKEDVEVIQRNRFVTTSLDDPIGIDALQPYRFGLHLSDYIDNMPNNAAIRVVIETEERRFESERLYLFTY
jgi:hypothetical protein